MRDFGKGQAMDEPNISPLARRLAEQNDVDWRKLSGSGPDGRILERDVIEHLARAMGGEEVEPSPEPLPWPNDDEEALLIVDDEPVAQSRVAYDDEIALDFEEVRPTEAGEDEALLELDDFVAAAGPRLEEDISLFEDETKLAADDTGAVAKEADVFQLDLASEESLLARGLESEPPAPEGKTAAPEEAAVLGKLPLASPGLLLRSRIKLTPLAEAQAAVARSLGEDILLAAFLVRAAAKALHSQGLDDDKGIGLAILSERGLGIKVIPEAGSIDFVQLVKSVTELSASNETNRDEAGLLVADMSNYAVDEAILNVGMPVLTLGRILVDSGSSYSYSTLSLAGDLLPATAAKFLSRAAELLSSPIELII